MRFSGRSLKLSPSALQSFAVKVKEIKDGGQDIISFGVGEPYQNLSVELKDAVMAAVNSGRTKYIPASGSVDFKIALARKYDCQPDEVIVTHGAKTALSAILWTMLNPDDGVLVPEPYYPPYLQVAESCQTEISLIDTRRDDFQLTASAVAGAMRRMKYPPKLLLINSPNNPTGAVYHKDELKKIAEICGDYGCTIVADECYANFSADQEFSLRQIAQDAVVINSVSKSHTMTGLRIGWAICSREIAERAKLFLENYIGCPNALSERAALAALGRPSLEDYIWQRRIVKEWFDDIGITLVKPEGAFYAFADFSKFIKGEMNDSFALADYLLNHAGVAVIPGGAFGKHNYLNYLRISFAVPQDKLRLGLKKIKLALNKL